MSNATAARYRRSYYDALAGFAANWEKRLTILLYHGVTATASKGVENYTVKHVTASEFRRDMAWLKEHCTVQGMDEVVEIARNGDPLPPRAAAVTFDDGFANNHTVAAPILDELDIPATFYITAGIVNTNLMFWVDKLEDCLNLTTNKNISVELGGKTASFGLQDAAARVDAIDTIKAWCKQADVAGKNAILQQVEAATGITPAVHHAANYEKITWSQTRELADHPRFIVGGHSLYHDILAAQSMEREADDIKLCQGLLSHVLERPIDHFSYPEGQSNHYRPETISALKACGVVCSPSAICGTNSSDELDPFHLRRIMVGFYGIPLPWLDARLMA